MGVSIKKIFTLQLFFTSLGNMTVVYIIGGGPTGMSLARLCKSQGIEYKVFEGSDRLGGSHAVYRDPEGLYTAHDPKVYSNAYALSWELFPDLREYMVNYNYSSMEIILKTIKAMNLLDWPIVLSSLPLMPLVLLKDVSVSSMFFWCSPGFRKHLDRVCLLTDGADFTRYPMSKFLGLINHQLFSQLLVPGKSLDKFWELEYKKHGSRVDLNSKLVKLSKDQLVFQDKTIVFGPKDKVLVCCPPSSWPESLGTLEGSDYQEYLSITFHWKKGSKDIPSIQYGGIPKKSGPNGQGPNGSDLDLSYVNTTLYSPDEPSWCISVGLAVRDKMILPTDSEIAKELGFKGYFKSIRFSGPAAGYIKTVSHDYSAPDTIFPNVKCIGPQNGNSSYPFTSFESAVQNAYAFFADNLDTKSQYTFWKFSRALTLLFWLTVLTVLTVLCKLDKSGLGIFMSLTALIFFMILKDSQGRQARQAQGPRSRGKK